MDRTVRNVQQPLRPPAWLWRWTIGVIALGWASLFAVNALRALHDVLVITLVAFLAACALEQPVAALARRGVRRGVATFSVLFASLVVGVGITAAGGAVIAGQMRELRAQLPELTRTAAQWAGGVGLRIDADAIAAQAQEWVASAVQDNAGSLLMRGGVLVTQVMIGALLTFYLVADGPRLRRGVCSVLPPQRQQQVLDVWDAAINKAGGFFVVRAILAACASVAALIFFTILGVDYALALALWVGVVSQVIPAVGTYLAGALPLLVAIGDGTAVAVAIVVFLVVYQQVENYLLSPRISRRVMELHPATAFMAAVCGAVLAGTAGALIAVPLVATIQAIIAASVERHQLVENDLFNSHVRTPAPRRTRNNKNRKKSGDRTTSDAAVKKASQSTATPTSTTPKNTSPAKTSKTAKAASVVKAASAVKAAPVVKAAPAVKLERGTGGAAAKSPLVKRRPADSGGDDSTSGATRGSSK